MKKILSIILTPIHVLVFGFFLVLFDGIQRVAYALGGYLPHKQSVALLNFFLTWSVVFLGSIPRWRQPEDLPTDRPLILVANHQSLFDIPPFFWYLRKHHVKFISKKELAKGVPSISFNLRNGKNAIIDRKDPRQALPEIKKLAEYIEENNYAAVIFPEGTRSKTGEPRPFSPNGLKMLLKYAPSSLVVPITINQTWKFTRYGKFPMEVGVQPTWDIHSPIDPKGRPFADVFAEVERKVTEGIVVG